MARILGIDYGIKKCGIAVTDPLQIIVNPLKTVKTSSLPAYLKLYFEEEEVEEVVIGLPTHADGNPTYLVPHIHLFAKKLKKANDHLKISFQDENFSSVMAKEIMLKGGYTKKQRQDKTKLDKISAVIILQRYLKHI